MLSLLTILLGCKSGRAGSGSMIAAMRPDTASARIYSGHCGWRLVLGEGERWDLLGRTGAARVGDVTAIAVGRSGLMCVSASPLYGKPGIWIQEREGCDLRRAVGPRHISDAYPDGEDYFELIGIDELDSRMRIRYWYSTSVDTMGDSNDRRGMTVVDTIIVIDKRN